MRFGRSGRNGWVWIGICGKIEKEPAYAEKSSVGKKQPAYAEKATAGKKEKEGFIGGEFAARLVYAAGRNDSVLGSYFFGGQAICFGERSDVFRGMILLGADGRYSVVPE